MILLYPLNSNTSKGEQNSLTPWETTTGTFDSHVIRSCSLKTRQICFTSWRQANNYFVVFFFSIFELRSITKHLMTGSTGNSEFCFPSTSMFPLGSGKQNSLFSLRPVIKGRTIRKVMGRGGRGIFSARIFFFRSLLVQEFFFRVKPSARIFFQTNIAVCKGHRKANTDPPEILENYGSVFSKSSQEVTLTITMRDRNHALII